MHIHRKLPEVKVQLCAYVHTVHVRKRHVAMINDVQKVSHATLAFRQMKVGVQKSVTMESEEVVFHMSSHDEKKSILVSLHVSSVP